MIVRDYHINKNRVSDIWDNCECLQQSRKNILAEMSIASRVVKCSEEIHNSSKTVHLKTRGSSMPKEKFFSDPIQLIPEELGILYEMAVKRNEKKFDK